jgi:hypothetical protein
MYDKWCTLSAVSGRTDYNPPILIRNPLQHFDTGSGLCMYVYVGEGWMLRAHMHNPIPARRCLDIVDTGAPHNSATTSIYAAHVHTCWHTLLGVPEIEVVIVETSQGLNHQPCAHKCVWHSVVTAP